MRMLINPACKEPSKDGMPPPAPEIFLEHVDERMVLSVSAFNSAKKTFLEDVDVCEHINVYWAQLSLVDQQKIFDIYKRIYGVFQRYFNTFDLSIQLRPLIAELYQYHQLDKIEQWINYKLDVSIYIPSRYKEEFVYDPNKPMTREKTYTRADYKHLVALAVGLRPMIPVWGEFLDRTKNETGTRWKELYTYLLLTDTKLEHSSAMEKLQTYINSHIKTDDKTKAKNANMIAAGLSTEDYDRWVLGALLVNRIAVGDVRGSESTQCLVVHTHKYVTSRIAGANGTTGAHFGEQIRDKDFRTSGNDEQEISPIEAYKIREKRSTGSIAPFELFLNNPHRVAEIVYPAIDHALLDRFLAHTASLLTEQIWPCQITITQTVLARAMSPRALKNIDKAHTLVAIAIAQAVLWQRGHYKLAGLLTCSATDNTNSQQISNTGIGRLPEEMQKEIFTLYPYQRYTKKRENNKPPHNVIVAIDNLAKQFNARDWILTLPDDMTQKLMGTSLSRRYPCPYDIRTQLGKLTIEVARRAFTRECEITL